MREEEGFRFEPDNWLRLGKNAPHDDASAARTAQEQSTSGRRLRSDERAAGGA
jgi:hypothetical protein